MNDPTAAVTNDPGRGDLRPWRASLRDDDARRMEPGWSRRAPLGGLPAPRSLLTVCAHPDDESFGLGALLTAFVDAGTSVFGLCFTHGEASSLHGVAGDLRDTRANELAAAAQVLGVGDVALMGFADGGLAEVLIGDLAAAVTRRVAATGAEALLVFDEGGVTGHPDHQRATEAALRAVEGLGLPVLAWAIPNRVAAALNAEFGTNFGGRRLEELDAVLRIDRRRQRRAIACHASQSLDNPVLWRRLDLLGDAEAVRWLRRPAPSAFVPAVGVASPQTARER
jgi:LmbE family N-acetylglucosaminyl deacetylase